MGEEDSIAKEGMDAAVAEERHSPSRVKIVHFFGTFFLSPIALQE